MKWSAENLIQLQEKYAERFREAPLNFESIKAVAGLDAAYKGNLIVACSYIKNLRTGEEKASFAVGKVNFPYIPGFLAFREGPWLLAALKKADLKPDLIFVDGNGLLHPRRAGLAVFVGVKTAIPTIGFTKNPFYLKGKKCEKESRGFIFLDGKKAGLWVCRRGVRRPVFLSPGNLITPEDCLKAYLLFSNSRIPFPVRKAHQLARRKLLELADI